MNYPDARKSALKDRLLPLLRHDAPSGCEEAVLAYLAEQACPTAATCAMTTSAISSAT